MEAIKLQVLRPPHQDQIFQSNVMILFWKMTGSVIEWNTIQIECNTMNKSFMDIFYGTNAFSSWKSIPWNISTPVKQGNHFQPEVNINITAAICDHSNNFANQTWENNRKRVMSMIFSAYLWLKYKTKNWTHMDQFSSFTSSFSKCDDKNWQKKTYIDLVDILGYYLFLCGWSLTLFDIIWLQWNRSSTDWVNFLCLHALVSPNSDHGLSL